MQNYSNNNIEIEVVLMRRIPPKAKELEKNSCSESVEPECMKQESPDKITRNPFFNFLRDFRLCHKGLLAKEVAIQGAEEWNQMPEESRSKYNDQASNTPKKNYQRKQKQNASAMEYE